MGFNGTFYDLINNIFIGFLLWGLCDLTYPIEPNMTIFIPLYILGLIYCKLCERTLGQILRELPFLLKKVKGKDSKKNEVKEYYEAYYKFIPEYCKKNLPILEAQLAFIRNLYPIVFIHAIFPIHTFGLFHSFTFSPIILLFSILIVISLTLQCPCAANEIKKIINLSIKFIVEGKHITIPIIIVAYIILLFFWIHTPPYTMFLYKIEIKNESWVSTLCYNTNTIKEFARTLVLVLPFIGYNLQKQIYSLIIEGDKYSK